VASVSLESQHLLARAGTGDGRVYTIACTDSAGNASTRELPVTVPHSRNR